MREPAKDDPEARVEAQAILYWAQRLNVTPEELRSAVQEGGTMVRDVIAELARLGFEHRHQAAGEETAGRFATGLQDSNLSIRR